MLNLISRDLVSYSYDNVYIDFCIDNIADIKEKYLFYNKGVKRKIVLIINQNKENKNKIESTIISQIATH